MTVAELKIVKARLHDKIRLAKERVRSLVTSPNANPIFILGNQKSGTSAICGLLGEATNQSYIIDFVGGWAPYISNLINQKTPLTKFVKQNSWAFSHQIIKEPNLTFVAEQLVTNFPDSHFIYVVRNPFDNIRSILNRLKISGTTTKLTDFSSLNKTWKSILTGDDLGIESSNPIEVLAHRWNRSNSSYLNNKGRYILIKYESFNADKSGCLKRIALSTNLHFSNDITHLTEKNFQPKGDNSLKRLDYFGDENYQIIKNLCLDNWLKIDKFDNT